MKKEHSQHDSHSQNEQQELQRKYLQLQLSRQQLEELIEEKKLINQKFSEIAMSIDAVSGLGTVSEKSDMWSPFGSGLFVESSIKDTEKILVNVGANIFLRKSRDDAKEMLQQRLDELSEIDREVSAEINRFGEQVEKLENELEKLAERSQK